MTEDEAREKWCPMVRLHAGEGAVCNVYSDGDIPEFSNCIASDCMMWRWDTTPGQTECGYGPSIGHCGLSGKP